MITTKEIEEMKESTFEGVGRLKIFTRSWQPEGKARGVVVLHREFPLIKLPVLILHGTEDKATNPSGSQFFYDNAGSTDKTLKLYEGHYHDLLNDVDKEIVMADIHDWINARVPVTRTKSATL